MGEKTTGRTAEAVETVVDALDGLACSLTADSEITASGRIQRLSRADRATNSPPDSPDRSWRA
jgi:hypothetical protein